MLIQILKHTPLWVWAVLTALVALGLWQSRQRHVRRSQLLALPLVLLMLGLWPMAPGFVARPLVAGAWLLALLVAAQLGRRLPTPAAARWLAAEERLQLPGSWVPLVIILCIFSLRYATGVSLALHPEWRSMLSAQLPLALAFGTLSGIFLGRALGLRALTLSPAATGSAAATGHAH
jgi:hypothetical protein